MSCCEDRARRGWCNCRIEREVWETQPEFSLPEPLAASCVHPGLFPIIDKVNEAQRVLRELNELVKQYLIIGRPEK